MSSPVPGPAPAGARRPPEVAASTIAYDGHDLAVALASLAGLGFEAVELAHIEGYAEAIDDAVFATGEAARAVALLREHGLRCSAVSAHIDLGAPGAADRMARRLEFCARVGARRVVTNAAPRAEETAFYAAIEVVAREAEQTGTVVCLENPGNGVPNVLDGGAGAVEVMRRLAHPLVRLNYDFANALSHFPWRFSTEQDFLQALPWMEQLHLKDVRRAADGSFSFPALGEGEVDLGAVLSRLGEPAPAVVSLELPLRLRRRPGGSPWRLAEPLSLAFVEDVLARSRTFVLERLAPAAGE